MNAFGSLTNRIFFATALLAVLSIGVAIYIVNRAVTRQAEAELVRGVEEAAGLVEEYRSILFDNFKRDARIFAEIPQLKAALDTRDPLTVEGVAKEYQGQLANADLFAIADRQGRLLVKFGAAGVPDQALVAAMQSGATRGSTTAFSQEGRGILLVTSVPVPDPSQPDPLGTLSIGTSFGDKQAQRFKTLTDSEIAFGVNGAIQASTLPRDAWGALAPLLAAPGVHNLTIRDPPQLRTRAHGDAAARRDYFDDEGDSGERRPDAADSRARRRTLAGRGRAPPRNDVQLDDRIHREVPARSGAARAPVVARTAVHGRRARNS